jgi:hypothetical protein
MGKQVSRFQQRGLPCSVGTEKDIDARIKGQLSLCKAAQVLKA